MQPQGTRQRALHTGQALPWRATGYDSAVIIEPAGRQIDAAAAALWQRLTKYPLVYAILLPQALQSGRQHNGC